MKHLLAVSLSCASFVSFAFDWPSGGTATIPAGTSVPIATAEDVSAVAKLDAIVFEDETSSVVYTDASHALVLKADLSGPGSFVANGAKKITLSGDNHLLTGALALTNTPIEVVSRYGFGSRDSRVSLCQTGKGGTLTFSATGPDLVLDAPVLVDGSFTFGPESTTDTLIISNDLRQVTGGATATTYFRFKNKVRYESGTFGALGGSHVYPNIGKACEIWITGETRISTVGSTYWMMSGGRNSKVHWDIPDDQIDKLTAICPQVNGPGVFVCERDNVLLGNHYFNCYAIANASSTEGYLDLNGHDQTTRYLYNVGSVSEAGMQYAVITSGVPATVTVTQSNSSTYTMAYMFRGAASLHFAGGKSSKHCLRNAVSDTTGELKVSSGTLDIDWGAGWGGTNVTVCGTGTLNCISPNSIAAGTARLAVSDTGKLTVANLVSVTVKSAKLGETELERNYGGYTAADLEAAGLDGFVQLGADARLIVLGESGGGEWTGWPDTPGETVSIPDGETAYIDDADVEKVASYAGIKIGTFAKVVVRTTGPYVLRTPVQGFGSFECATPSVTILSDNSGLRNPGGFVFTPEVTSVVVSNGFGLGSVITGAAQLQNDFTARHTLLFSGGGEMTNDVALTLSGSWSLGTTDMDTTLVQTKDVLRDKSGNAELCYLYLLGRYTQLKGRFGSLSDTFFFSGRDNAVVRIGEEAELYGSHTTFVYGGKFWLYLDGTVNISSDFIISHEARVVCGHDEILAKQSANSMFRMYQSTAPFGCLDLNGHDQTVHRMECQAILETDAATTYQSVVTSAVPATLTVDGNNANVHYLPQVFVGEAGFRQNSPSTSHFVTTNAASTTAGTLRISQGKVVFDYGSGWVGSTNVVVDGGTLRVETTSVGDVFNGKAVVRVSNGGKIEMGDGIRRKVRCVSLNGEFLPAGVYGGSAAEAAGLVSGAFVRSDIFGTADSGTLHVRRSSDVCGCVLLVR